MLIFNILDLFHNFEAQMYKKDWIYHKKTLPYLHRRAAQATIQNTNTTKRDIFMLIECL